MSEISKTPLNYLLNLAIYLYILKKSPLRIPQITFLTFLYTITHIFEISVYNNNIIHDQLSDEKLIPSIVSLLMLVYPVKMFVWYSI